MHRWEFLFITIRFCRYTEKEFYISGTLAFNQLSVYYSDKHLSSVYNIKTRINIVKQKELMI